MKSSIPNTKSYRGVLVEKNRQKELKEMLLGMKKEKMSTLKHNAEDMESVDNYQNDAQDFADTATNIYEKELHYDLTEKNKQLLMQIEEALKRIEEGVYGQCDKCGKDISVERLKALPFSKLCIKCQSGVEKK